MPPVQPEYVLPSGLFHWKSDKIEDEFGTYVPKNDLPQPKKICDSILDTVGRTPLVKLNRIPKDYGIECDVYAKCEFLNGGGSVKDRIALKMVELAEQSGRLRPGMTIIEPTSGNTGIGLALVAAVKGYSLLIVMPNNQSREKEVILKALGAKVVRTDFKIPTTKLGSHIGEAFRLHYADPKNTVVLFQYRNVGNPMAHYETTGIEIAQACGNKVDAICCGMGTGGTITGISKRVKQVCPTCKIVGADPIGEFAVGVVPNHEKNWKVEGIGFDNISTSLIKESVDQFEKVDDLETFTLARRLNRDEGILSGGSAGSSLAGALRIAKTLQKGQKCICLLPDGISNYLTKFLADDWMKENGFMDKNKEQDQLKPDLKSLNDGGSVQNVYDPESTPQTAYQFVPKPWHRVERKIRPLLFNNVLEAIGNTPMVRLNRVPQEENVQAEILVKCEYLNPGGSVKDRIALKMVELAEREGVLKPGMTIIEATSGNTGVGLALVAAVKGYRCIIVLPKRMSIEKEQAMRSLGAQIVRSECSEPYSDPRSHIATAQRLLHQIPGSIILDQYRNQANPLAHYEGTAAEILDACDGRIDAIVIGAGTGGTVTGTAKRVKEDLPNCKVYAVDVSGSVLADAGPESFNNTVKEINKSGTEVEGLGQAFKPAVLDLGLLDGWVRVTDADSLRTARRLIRHEGLLCGPSAGANVWAAIQVAKKLGPGRRVVTILPDGVRNSLTKFVDDEWMKAKGFL